MNKLLIFLLLFLSLSYSAQGSDKNYAKTTDRIWLDSKEVHQGEYTWKMMKVGDVKASAESRCRIYGFPYVNPYGMSEWGR